MVRLKKLRKNQTTIEADIYPENSTQPGHIIVSLESQKILGQIDPKGYEGFSCCAYVAHAKKALLKLADQDPLPDTYLVMWY